MPAQKKIKLRTASDVLSRLKWSNDEQMNAQNTIMGYDCRIHGPLEKCVDDYSGINEGGDIPEHRIQYFRLAGSKDYEKLIFWDRNGRVDRLFGSGNPDDPISPMTVQNVAKAIATMKSIAEEKAIRAQEKAKRKARQQAKKTLAAKFASTMSSSATESTERRPLQESSKRSQRHVWQELDRVFVFDSSKCTWAPKRSNGFKSQQFNRDSRELKFITWNVLFDLHRNESDELVQGDDTLLNDQDSTTSRWQNLIDDLEVESADAISLQEVTPRFVQQLQRCQWVQDLYALSAESKDLRGVETYGNLILWKTTSFQGCKGLHLCVDQGRNRGIVVSLARNNTVFNVANVHLPADQRDKTSGETRDRTKARQREFGSIVGKLQLLEQNQRKQNLYPVPVVMGDFNSGENEPNIFKSEHFVDAWLHPSNKIESEHSFTFDWKRNQRANKTRQHGHQKRDPRRIDRIVLGSQDDIVPTHSCLVGDSSVGLPASDHFGVSVTFEVKAPRLNMQPILYTPSRVEHNVWAATAIPTTDSLLALLFEDQQNDSLQLCDPSSTLPITHITLLNGFVDLSTSDNQALATQAVKDAVHQALYSSSPLQEWALDINDKSLSVFEHRESATLVCTPDKTGWLNRLYETLRVTFEGCDEQERRFSDGWTPHMSLEKHATTTTARAQLDQLLSSGAWKGGMSLNGFGIGLFRRDMVSRKFFPVATVPLVNRQNVAANQTKLFLQTAGLPWARSFERLSQIVLRELESACQHTISSLCQGSLTSTVSLYGSQALGVALPGISDIDAVVHLQSSSDTSEIQNISGSKFFQLVRSHLEDLHLSCKARLRVSSLAGFALYVLTIKLAPNLPAADLLLARTLKGETVDVASRQALASIDDSQVILQRVQELGMKSAVFQGTLRMIKLWAQRRGIYGSSMGYLGGGGWAVLLVCVLEHKTEWNGLIDTANDAASASQIATFFLCHVLEYWSNARVVTLQGTNSTELKDDQRNNIVVLAPKSGGNFGRSSTRSTTQQTWNELRRAAQLFDGEANTSNLYSHLETCMLSHIVGGGVSDKILALQVPIPIKSASLKPAEVKARATVMGLSTTVALERILPADIIRPHSQVVRKNGAFWLLLEVQCSERSTSKALSAFVDAQNELLQQQMNLGSLTSQLVQFSPKEFQSLSMPL
ncbi:unnamed protein product [Cylindrotheca closterium]|uniref:Polynucleotide adenylyltransferase n=1 Tax=Cylindrotheca closterium TaxID=2856 RepID=A0AAD2FUP8_9STRA|nr:unnamed protein product [Cylindrotheca closterium]